MSILRNFYDKLLQALSSEWGWFLTVITSVFVSAQSIKLGFYVVTGAVIADMFWGVWASIILKKFLISWLFRETFKKIAIYSFALFGALAIETLAVSSNFIAFKTIAVLIAVCEFWSMSASMLIVKPNMPFLKIMRGQLKGEIRDKVGNNINLDAILKDDKHDKPGDPGLT